MFQGTVIHGDGLGKGLGYPTANLDTLMEEIGLPSGVYAAWVVVRGHKYGAALIISSSIPKVEVYVLDYAGPSLYGASLEVEAKDKVSEIETLQGQALQEKIARDIVAVRGILLE